MNIHLACVALCSGLFLSTCLSAVVYSEKGLVAEEEKASETKVNVLKLENVEKTHTTNNNINPKTKQEDCSSSEESKSQDHTQYKNFESSESDEHSSSEEKTHVYIKKRSLESNLNTLNAIDEKVNQTNAKETTGIDKDSGDLTETTSSNIDNLESTTTVKDELDKRKPELSLSNEEPSDNFTSQPTVRPETSSFVVVSETTTTTEILPEGEVETELETTTENVVETTDIKAETTTEVHLETKTELDFITTTAETNKDTNSSSEENEEETPESFNSTDTSAVEPLQPEDNNGTTFMEAAMKRVNKLSDQIRLVLMHYRKDQVVVIPGQSFFPEPMEMQDFQRSFSIGTMNFKNMRVFGLSNFTVEHINTDVDRMQVYILLHMKRLVILGNYTLRTFFSRAAGPFNVTLLDVDSEGVAEIETAPEGHLVAADSVMDMFTSDMRVDFKNLGFMGSMFQGMVSAVGDALFNSIKPQILERVNIVIRTDVNKKLKEFSTKFINKIAPVDLAFSEGRKYVKNNGYDPYNIKDHTFLLGGLVYVNITQFWVEGLSKFYRVGNLSLSMDAGIIQIGVHVMTSKLTGHCIWSGQTFGIVKSGKTNFTVDHLQVRAVVNQSLDIRRKPQLEDLDLELGWVKVTMDSPITLNLMIEGIINAFPRLIRHIIVDTLEQPLKEKIQEILNKINIESFVDDNLPRLDSLGL